MIHVAAWHSPRSVEVPEYFWKYVARTFDLGTAKSVGGGRSGRDEILVRPSSFSQSPVEGIQPMNRSAILKRLIPSRADGRTQPDGRSVALD